MSQIRKFHENFAIKLQTGSVRGLRITAARLDEYINENAEFKDAQFLPEMLRIIEFAIQKRDNTDWTVAKSKTDLRGKHMVAVNAERKAAKAKAAKLAAATQKKKK